MRAHWSNFETSYSRGIDSGTEALELIDELMSSVTTPAMIEFRDDPVGLAFGYAVGRESAVLTFQRSNDPPYYISIGDSREKGTEWFCYGRQHSEYLRCNSITHDHAKEALKEFFITQDLPTSVAWKKL